MDLNEIQSLIKFVAKSGVQEVELETKEFKIVIKTPSARKNEVPAATPPVPAPVLSPGAHIPHAVPSPAAAPQAPAAEKEPPVKASAPPADESRYIMIKSPMIGTFYRSPGPEKPVFVSAGDEVTAGKVICIIEAMKLFNEIESEVSGRIVKVLADDATPVEYDQPLFLVDPA